MTNAVVARPALSYVVPTIGVPEHLAGCLEAIYLDASDLEKTSELVVVWQHPVATSKGLAREEGSRAGGPAALRILAGKLATDHPDAFDRPPRIVKLPRPVGFARAANRGIATSRGEWIALVNDDLTLHTGWARLLLEALRGDRHTAAAQGVNLLPAAPTEAPRIDGAGLTWNRRWQAIQQNRAEPAPPPGGQPRPLYGVSATAAIYSRPALIAVSPPGGPRRPFDERLDSYYEDVELADRLHRASFAALLVPAARTEHAGAMSSRDPRAARRRVRRIYSNRLLVLARRLGRGFWLRLPRFLLRDAADMFGRSKATALPGDLRRPGLADLLFAWCRAAWLLPRFAGFGPSLSNPWFEEGQEP